MLSLKTFSLLDRCQEEKELVQRWSVFDKTQPRTSTKEPKNEDRPYSTPRSSPNAEGLQTNLHNISPPWESRRQLLLTCERSENLKGGGGSDSHKKNEIFRRKEYPIPLTYVRQRCREDLTKM